MPDAGDEDENGPDVGSASDPESCARASKFTIFGGADLWRLPPLCTLAAHALRYICDSRGAPQR
eukprot:11019131-Lingulodinium_polyedra.AAC.1